MAQQAPDREKALELAIAQIEKNHGKGSVMRPRGRRSSTDLGHPDGSIALDVALGIGGLPGPHRRDLWSGIPRARRRPLHAVANAQAAGGIAAFIDAEHAPRS